MESLINIGVIGCGYWGPNLIRNFNSLSNCRVKAASDLNIKRLTHMEKLYPGIETTTEYEQLINDPEIDALVIATPVHLHFEMASKSLAAGKHTFIEKPIASSSTEGEKLMEMALSKRLTLMVGHTFIYSPPIRKIKEIVRKGDLGELQYISAQRLNLGLFQTDINVAWDLAPHDISIILYVLGSIPTTVNCQGKSHVNPGIEDVTNMSLGFSDGGFATIHSSWLDPNKIREMTFVGSKRMLAYNDIESMEKIKIYDKRVEIPPHYDTFAEFQYSYHYGDMYSPYIEQEEPLRIQSQHFLDCINTGKPPITGAAEGLAVVRVLEAASESLRIGGGPVNIKNDN